MKLEFAREVDGRWEARVWFKKTACFGYAKTRFGALIRAFKALAK